MTLPHASFEKTLEQVSHEISGAFSIAFFELETIRSTAAGFGTDIAKLLSATSPENAQEDQASSFEMFLQNAASAAAAAGGAAESLTNRAFQGALIRISGSLHEMKKHTTALTSISSLTKITQSETQDMGDRLATFTNSLDYRCLALREATARSAGLVVETQRQSGLARESLTAIGLEFRALSENAGDEASRLNELERRHNVHMATIRDDANELDGEVKRAVRNLIGCLQFPDTFAQRAEHMRTAMAAMDKASPAEQGSLAKVIVAQLRSMAAALQDIATTAGDALRSLRAALERSSIVHNRNDAADPSDAWMVATAQANEVMLRAVARAREQFDAALQLLSGLTCQIDATKENLETSVQLNRDLEISVYNASLVAHRSGSQTSPLRFLAKSVKDVVDRTSGRIAQISEELEHIRGTSEALTTSNLGHDLQTLLTLQETSSSETEKQSQKLDHVRDMRRQLLGHADRLDGAATAGNNAFDLAADYANTITDLASKIDGTSIPFDPTECDLDWLYTLYTMEEERVVHRQALGLPEVETADADAGEDFDDFLL